MENKNTLKKPLKRPLKPLKKSDTKEVDKLEEALNQNDVDLQNTLGDENLELEELEELEETIKPTLQEKPNIPQKEKLASQNIQADEEDKIDPLQALVKQTSVKQFSSSSGRGGLISIVKSSNGTRLVINKSANEQLGYPSEIYFGCENEYLIIFDSQDTPIQGKKVPANNNGKLTIYDAALVNEIIEAFNLDYSDVTSKSFAQGRFEDKGRPVLYVKMV